MIKVMGIEYVMRDLCDYYESIIDPNITRIMIKIWLSNAYRKIFYSHEKIRGDQLSKTIYEVQKDDAQRND